MGLPTQPFQTSNGVDSLHGMVSRNWLLSFNRLLSFNALVFALAFAIGANSQVQTASGFPAETRPSPRQDDDRSIAPPVQDQEIDAEYLKKWTPIRRTESRFPYEDETDADWVDARFQEMDTGPTFCGSIKTPGKGMTPKAMAIKLRSTDNDNSGAAVLFDTQNLNVRAAWTGGFLELPPKRFGMLEMPSVKGQLEFASDWNQSWSWQNDQGQTTALSASSGQFKKYALHGNLVELTYSVNGTTFSEINAGQTLDGGQTCFQRILECETNERSLVLSLLSVKAESFRVIEGKNQQTIVVRDGKDSWLVRLKGKNTQLKHEVDQQEIHTVSLAFPASTVRATADLAIVKCQSDEVDKIVDPLEALSHVQIPNRNQPRWGQPIVTRGKRANDAEPLVVDEITVPYENRYHALMYTSGFDFLPDHSAMVCTMHGDVWKVTGIDERLEKITWQRFATGLYQPLGLKVVDGKIYVLGRDRITRLVDRNDDGEADEYQNFCDLLQVTGQPHAYAMSLETDSNGNFYFIKSGGSAPHGGTMIKVSSDGKRMDVVATGYRHANGLGIGPNDEITSADNEGNWIPTTRIDLVQPGGFYGHMPTHRREPEPTTYDGPLCWVPRLIDNSAGGQVWVDSKSWGPLNNKLLHLSFGRCTANVVLTENVQGLDQAGIYKLALPTFLSGSMRGRFNSRDGHLYLVGLDGWQTAAVRDGCFQRVRATGKQFHLPVDLKVKNSRIEITFSDPVDIESAQSVTNWNVQQWNYQWTEAYGSDHYKVSNPTEVGHDEVTITGVEVSADQRTVTLNLDDLQPVMQMQITGNIKANDGTLMPIQIFNTIHAIGD